MKSLLSLVITITGLTWLASVAIAPSDPSATLPWIMRQEGLHLSGVLSIALMSLAMILAVRPGWLERPLGGLDRSYRLHKWAGIIATGFAAAHWLIEMSDDLIRTLWGRIGRTSVEHFTGIFGGLQDVAEDAGEWAIYLVIGMVLLTLWKRFPYLVWRHLHRAMPVIYLMLAFHAALLAPSDYWMQPIGIWLGILLLAGSVASFISLAGHIGRKRQTGARIIAVNHPSADITEIHCQPQSDDWTHKPGQFAFLTFDSFEGAHPFTIASASRTDGTLVFQIKAAGDFTKKLKHEVAVGQSLRIEGPYGRFTPDHINPNASQVWIAAGIGITPFIAWLESFSSRPTEAPQVQLHYIVRDTTDDPFVSRLKSLCGRLPGVALKLHATGSGNRPDAHALLASTDAGSSLECWFCGPRSLATMLRNSLSAMDREPARFHQELFEMR